MAQLLNTMRLVNTSERMDRVLNIMRLIKQLYEEGNTAGLHNFLEELGLMEKVRRGETTEERIMLECARVVQLHQHQQELKLWWEEEHRQHINKIRLREELYWRQQREQQRRRFTLEAISAHLAEITGCTAEDADHRKEHSSFFSYDVSDKDAFKKSISDSSKHKDGDELPPMKLYVLFPPDERRP